MRDAEWLARLDERRASPAACAGSGRLLICSVSIRGFRFEASRPRIPRTTHSPPSGPCLTQPPFISPLLVGRHCRLFLLFFSLAKLCHHRFLLFVFYFFLPLTILITGGVGAPESGINFYSKAQHCSRCVAY